MTSVIGFPPYVIIQVVPFCCMYACTLYLVKVPLILHVHTYPSFSFLLLLSLLPLFSSLSLSLSLSSSHLPSTCLSPPSSPSSPPPLSPPPPSSHPPKVLDHYENPRNVGSMDKKDTSVGTGLVGAPACGDVMKLQVSKTHPLHQIICVYLTSVPTYRHTVSC